MEFLATLKRSLIRNDGGKAPPGNLMELYDLLLTGPASEQCRLWAGRLRGQHDAQAASLGVTRGQSRRLWAEQSLIYQDLIASLEGLAANWVMAEVEVFAELLEEFRESVEAMDAWTRSEEPRCLACGWGGRADTCPHCRLHLLKPVRRLSPEFMEVPLAERQNLVFASIVGILEGSLDLETLLEPLSELHADYERVAGQLDYQHVEEYPEVLAVAQLLDQAQQGLQEISLAFEDYDAQHLEDGWHQFFVCEQTLGEVLAAVEGADQVSFSRGE